MLKILISHIYFNEISRHNRVRYKVNHFNSVTKFKTDYIFVKFFISPKKLARYFEKELISELQEDLILIVDKFDLVCRMLND